MEATGGLELPPLWRGLENLLRSVPGVGLILTLTPLAELPELGSPNRKQIAALVGVATLNDMLKHHTSWNPATVQILGSCS